MEVERVPRNTVDGSANEGIIVRVTFKQHASEWMSIYIMANILSKYIIKYDLKMIL